VSDSSREAAAAAIERIRGDIADLERLMVDMPPHHAGGTRRGAEERLEDLRVALRDAVRALDGSTAEGSAR
jgi:hypothetical protein